MPKFSKSDIERFQENLIFWTPYPTHINFYYQGDMLQLKDETELELLWKWIEDKNASTN